MEFIAAPDPARFEELALGVFRFQYEGNEPYRRFCDRRGRHPANVRHWQEVPAVPVAAFKSADLVVSGLPEGLTFLTSGTTRGAQARGRHRVAEPEIYRASALRHFSDCVLPDGARPRMIVLAPRLEEAPHSSLCRMIHWIEQAFASAPAEYCLEQTEAELSARLRELEALREPVLVIGVTYALIDLVARGLRFRLPYGSRIVDTGGTKGKSREMSRNGLLRAFWETFGVPGYFVANEYGMTEMCSQFYDDAIRNHVRGRKRDRSKIGPAWTRTEIVSVETLEPAAPGERGLLRHFDLANVASVSALQTEDVGVAVGDGFEILGRAAGAEARGCAMLVEEIVP